jgi:DNA-binding transcriptional LysR family regulator
MDRFEAMSMFLTAIDKGSLSAAAREMRVPVPTLSRKVAELETLLGAALLTRTTRKLALTDAGTAFAAAAKRILEQLDEAQRQAAGEFAVPKGDLIIAAPVLFGRLHVLPIVTDFLKRFPEVNVQLALGDRNLNLVDDHIDMAVRMGKLPDSGMVATRVGSMRLVVCGSPALLGECGVPRTPGDLTRMPCVASVGAQPIAAGWGFRHPETGAAITIPIAPRLASNAEAASAAAVQGIGFSRLRYYQVLDAVKAGKLRIVLKKYELEPAPVHLIHTARGQMPLKTRRFLDIASSRLRKTLAAINSA